MAMILEAFVGSYISMLADFIEERAVMALGVKDELKGLQEKLENIGGLLDDAERRRLRDPAINRWVVKLKDIMYDADDIIDLCRIKGAKRGRSSDDQASTSLLGNLGVSHLFSMLPNPSDLLSAHDIASRIKTLNDRLKEVTEDRIVIPRLGCSNRNVTASGVNLRQTSSLVELDVVGTDIEDATKGLVEMLVKEDIPKCCIFAIDGMGGIGKTTLAQKIFNDPKIVDNFQTRIWVCVSQEFSEIELLKQMIRGASGDHGVLSTKAELLPKLKEVVSGKRLFVVLDDVWQANVWIDLLRNPLQTSVAIGRILVTTRDENNARRMGAVHTHKVGQLAENFGWKLLCKKVFASGEEAEMEMLKDIGTQIVQKCHGLPLAIKTIAGLLSTKEKSRSHWEQVLRSDAWSMSNLPEELRGALYMSYEDLPSHLKQCFLYFALFPEDHRFTPNELVSFWVAEGFVKTKKDAWMKQMAEQYYEELIRRNILQLKYVESRECQMHDLLLSLAQHLSKDESFYGDVDQLKATTVPKLRRLSIARRGETAAVPSIIEWKCLRTLILLRIPSSYENDLLGRLTRLRILYINGTNIRSIPDSIGTLMHLRLLDLSFIEVSTLPESLGFLANLQILKLTHCFRLQTLPKSITRLFNLRYLAISNTPLSFLPKGIGKLEQLIELESFIVGDDGNGGEEAQGCELEELQSLSRLRLLCINRLERASNKARILDNKPYLKDLTLSCSPKNEMADKEIHRIEEMFEDLIPPRCIEDLHILNFFGRRYPGWMMSSSLENSLPNLKCLYLVNCKSCRELPPLGQLPQLTTLEIYDASAVVSIGPEFLGNGVRQGSHTAGPTFFPKLETLRLYFMHEWEEWEISGQAASQSALLLPRLKNLQLVDCPKLRGVENLSFLSNELDIAYSDCLEKISNLPAIKSLHLTNCSALGCVENLDALQHLMLHDTSMDSLPKWILGLLQERQHPHQNNLELILNCNVRLLKRCVRGRPDWPIIQQFSRVSANAYTGTKQVYLYYSKVPFSYQTNLGV